MLGGMIGGSVAAGWLLNGLEASANWMLVHWFKMDGGHAAARAPMVGGLMLCGLFGLGLYFWCRWDENQRYLRAAERRKAHKAPQNTIPAPAEKRRAG